MGTPIVALFFAALAGPALAGPALADDLDDGIAAYDAQDYRMALSLLQPLAKQGSALAQSYLGLMYDEGNGVPLDDVQAIHWYRLAAEQGDARAHYLLGTMYDFGEGVAEENAQAVRWYRLAAEQEDEFAQQLVESYEKFEIEGGVLAYDTGISEISAIDSGWLEDILLANPGITMMHLTSDGGDVLAAYPMADVIIDNELGTHVVGDCVSACTILFLADEARTMQRGSRLGFHQTSWDAENMTQYYEDWQGDFGWKNEFDFAEWVYQDAVNDVLVELRFMSERGVDPGFALKALDAKPDDMWYPRRTELVVAGVLRE